MSTKYTFIDNGLKKKYDNYYKIFMVSAVLGLLFAFVFNAKHELFGMVLPIIPNAFYIGCGFCLLAVVFIFLQFRVRDEDKKLKIEAMKQLDEQERKA